MSIAALIEPNTGAANDWPMSAAAPRKAKVTEEHLAESQRLRTLWAAYKAKPAALTQEKFGAEFDIGSQGAVNQFLKGDTPLSMKAAKGFAKGLGVSLAAFSPRLAAEVVEMAGIVPRPTPSLLQLDEMEAQLVLMFRRLDPDQQHTLLVKANNLYSKTHPGKSAANPYPVKELVHK